MPGIIRCFAAPMAWRVFAEGDIARFEDNDVHGFQNTSESEFEYLSVTPPPVNFRAAYATQWK